MKSSPRPGSETRFVKKGPSSKNAVYKKAPVTVRPAKSSDREFIGRLSGKVFNIYGPYEDIVYRWFESEMTVTLTALMERRPVGFSMIGQLSNEWNLMNCYELLAIAVDPGRQRMGIGERLIREIGRVAVKLNVMKLYLHTALENLPAQKLFIKNGYQRQGIKKNFYPAGQDAVVMYKEMGG